MLRTSRSLFGVLPFVAFSALACSAGDKNRGDTPGNLNQDGGTEGGLVIGDGGPGGPEIGIFSAVSITPSNPVIAIDTATTPPTAGKQTFTVRVRNEDGTETDVSSVALIKIDPKFGSFAGPEFTSVTELPDGKPQTTVFTAEVKDKDGKGKTGEAQITLIALRTTGDKRDFFFIEPYLGDPSPSRDVLKFGTNIKQVDVAFATDTTGSMGGVLENIKTSLTGKIFPELKKVIPNVGIAVTGFDDFPVSPFGGGSDMPFYLLQTVTTSITAAQAGVNGLTLHGGGDGPESDYECIYQILTGEGVNWAGGSIKKKTNAPGTYGYVDFRPGSLPVVVNITDISFHPKSDYAAIVTTPPAPHGVDEVKDAYKKTYARHVGISTGSSAYAQQDELANASGSYVPPSAFKGSCGAGQCCTNESGAGRSPDGPGGTCLMTFKASFSGTGVSDRIVDAIAALSAGSNFDVTAAASNDSTNPGGVDATKFIKALRAMEEGDEKEGCPAATAKDTDGDGIKDTFTGVGVGTPVCFEVIPAKNTFVEPTKTGQFFDAFIDVLGMPGSVKLDQRKVKFLVPPKDIIAK